ncbi:hypothetical protein ACWEP3_28265 [Streptomyces albidoflavus]
MMWADGAGAARHPRSRCLGDHGRGAAPCDQARTAAGTGRLAPRAEEAEAMLEESRSSKPPPLIASRVSAGGGEARTVR